MIESYYLARPAVPHASATPRYTCAPAVSRYPVFLYFFNDFCHTSHLSIYHTDILEIFSVGRTMGVGDQFEFSFSVPQGTLP